MKKIIIANFKMNQTVEETKAYFTKFLSKFDNNNVQVVICPPFTSLSVASFFTSSTDIKLGGQNVASEDNLTGEISAKMLKGANAEYVILGHTERREKFKETNSLINKKIKASLKQGLKCIVCVGETYAEKNTHRTAEIVKRQIEECTKGLYENELESLVIAYEPFWAVGKNCSATVKEIEEGAKIIRKAINDNYSEKASRDLLVVYGGGLNTLNASKLLSAKGIDGGMFGASALDADSFVSMINKIK